MPETLNYIILNGPPACGKTTISRELTRYLQQHGHHTVTDSFAAPMKNFIAAALGIKYHDFNKDAPRAELCGYSVREFLIHLSEHYMKDRYGEGIFGRWFAHRVARLDPLPVFVISDDCGFEEEFTALGRNKTLVRIERPGKDFSKDSRNYLPKPDYTLSNDCELEELYQRVHSLADDIIVHKLGGVK